MSVVEQLSGRLLRRADRARRALNEQRETARADLDEAGLVLKQSAGYLLESDDGESGSGSENENE